jgi:rhodanese-related sulfurtransferase
MEQVPARDVPTRLQAQQADGQQPVLLDVREAWEVALARTQDHPLPPRCIPMHEVPGRLAELDAGQPVWVLCHHGMRSAQVALFLERHGFEQVFNVAGGIDAWAVDVDPRVPRY